MLDPRQRSLLFDLLKPPPGYRLHRAVATTYSLDLTALLTLPLAFTLFGRHGADGRLAADPQALLEALQRCARRIDVFCQAGWIAVPARRRLLYSYLEGSVHEAVAPRGGAFHPKLTVLRFEPEEEGQRVRYRLICASRNLTFDRSWDTALTLEGELTRLPNGYRCNRPLSRLVAALPGMAQHRLSADSAEGVSQIAEELNRVRLNPPEGFYDELAFWPIGLEGEEEWPFEGRRDRVLVISPFLGDGLLERIGGERGEDLLVSRHESLDELKEGTLDRFEGCYHLSDAVETEDTGDEPVPETEGETEEENNPAQVGPLEEATETLTGLHAKLYAIDHGHYARILTGSANATDAAFGRNVELLVELTGTSYTHGVRPLLNRLREGNSNEDQDAIGFADLLELYRRSEPAAADPDQQHAEELVEQVRQQLAENGLAFQVQKDQSEQNTTLYRLELCASDGRKVPELPAEARVQCWPLTMKESSTAQRLAVERSVFACFGPLTSATLTCFCAFDVRVRTGSGAEARVRFVLTLPLHGAPEDRMDELLLALLEDREQLMRYLLMLLAEEGDAPEGAVAELADVGWQNTTNGTGVDLPLLEPMLKALDRDPGKLEAIERLVEQLERTEKGRALLPEGFDRVWPAIREAMGSRP